MMMMKVGKNVRYCSSGAVLMILLVLFPESCCCLNPSYDICSPSACGNIGNISFPFRLKNDPKHCGDPDPAFELECENNVSTIVYISSQKYKVKEIDYNNQTIRVADVLVNNNNICSFPNVSLYSDSLLPRYPYTIWIQYSIHLMGCPYPLKNSSLFTKLPTYCEPSINSSNHNHSYYYIKAGYMSAADVGDMCSVEIVLLTSWYFTDIKNVSFSEIHDSLLYGFQLSWNLQWSGCIVCYGRLKCPSKQGDTVTCRHSPGQFLKALRDHINSPLHGPERSGPSSAVIIVLLLILAILMVEKIPVIVFAGVTLPAMIILGFTSAFAFIFIQMTKEKVNVYWPVAHLRLIIGLFFEVRFIMVFPFFICFFIYKFRRRHLSRFAAIEDFLQSENNLMPIRYSYSDIKKMTRGFHEKLGQGGYGTVYKGKLRSGYDVAVKLLGKPGGNGQDFMNEIATIGRIHHVNVVNLVGYCAERSKRALVFNFMPNGSLDKYLYSRENTNFLSWERKYEIAIGVARGIEYLHKGCDVQILHFDIKPHNILLDDNFTPKITDFGLAKFFSMDKKAVTMTAIRGTIGYVAPELINRGFGEVSYKADVYSFGMLLMEMVGLNKNLKNNNHASSQYFPCWIYDCFEQGHDIEFGVGDDDDSNRELGKKMTIVALWCIQTRPGDRPSMNKVVEMLEAQVDRLRVPSRASQSARVAVNYEDQSWSTYSTDSMSLLPRDAASSIDITVED